MADFKQIFIHLPDIIMRYKNKLLFLLVLLVALSFFFVYSTDKFDRTSESYESDSVYALSSDEVLSQEITGFEDETLSAINIQFATYSKTNTGTIDVKLYKDGELYEEWQALSSLIGDNSYHLFELKTPVSLSENHKYEFSISESYEGDNCVGIWMNSGASDGKTINESGQQLTGSICYTLTYRNTALRHKVILIYILIISILTLLIFSKVNEVFVMGGCARCIYDLIYVEPAIGKNTG